MPKGCQAGAAKVGPSESLPGFHCLHSKVSPHRLWDGINVLAGLKALFRQKLDLGAPIIVSVLPWMQ